MNSYIKNMGQKTLLAIAGETETLTLSAVIGHGLYTGPLCGDN